MQFQSIAEEIKYLYKQIIFTYIRNKHIYYLELGNNGVFHEKNRIIVRCDKDEFIKTYIKELFPAPEIQSKIKCESNWYLIKFGLLLDKRIANLNYKATYEVIELIYKMPIKYFVAYKLWSVRLWMPYELISYIGLTDITPEQREALNCDDSKWKWTDDVFTSRNEEIAVKGLRAYMKALNTTLRLDDDAITL